MIVLDGIAKSYGEARALASVSATIEGGKIHALVGENGAGKSTLLRVAYGETRADAGTIAVDGVRAGADWSPARAIAAGVGMVHQHFMLVPTLDGVENVVLGREPRRGGMLDLDGPRREIDALAARLGLGVRLGRSIAELSVGERQRIEILKVVWRGARTLLFDEPTAVLSPLEVDGLFAVLRKLAAEGCAVAIVTHKLDEIAAIADEVTVLWRGSVAARFGRGAPPAEIAHAIVGGEPPPPAPARAVAPGEIVFAASELSVEGAVHGVELAIRRGEILGVAGVQGNGQRELVLALAGLLPARGRVTLDGAVLAGPPRERAARGVGHIPEDRHARGLVESMTLVENLRLGRHREASPPDASVLAAADVRPAEPRLAAGALSGGNQQKLVVARELGRRPLRLLLAAEPTRGVDLGATRAIHARLLAAADAGAAILLVSSELSELRALADRIVVFLRGRIVATIDRVDATDERLGALMTGAAA